MTARIQTNRLSATGATPGSGARTYGEFYINFPDLRLGVIKQDKSAQDLLPLRFFSDLAGYQPGDWVSQAGQIYVARRIIAPGAFNQSDWDAIPSVASNDARYLSKAGGTLTGPLVLAGDPTVPLGAATMQYVQAVAGLYLPLTGGTLSGALYCDTFSPAAYNSYEWTFSSPSNGDKIERFQSGSYDAFQKSTGTRSWVSNNVAGMSLDSTGDLDVRANLTAHGATLLVGQLVCNDRIYADNGISPSVFNGREWTLYTDSSGNHINSYRGGWYDVWASSGGARTWVANNVGVMTLDGSGNLSITGNFYTPAAITAGASVTSGYIHSTGSMNVDGGFGVGGSISVSGNFSAAGSVSAGYITSTGNINAAGTYTGGAVSVSGQVYGGNSVYSPGTGDFAAVQSRNGVFQVAPNYYMNRGNSGEWNWVEGGTINMTLYANGQLNLRGGLNAAGDIHGNALFCPNGVFVQDVSFGNYNGGSGRVMQFAGNWYWDWNSGNGTLVWVAGGANGMEINTNGWIYNRRQGFAGMQNYANISDIRLKQNIAPTDYGLPEVLLLEPIQFTRRDDAKLTVEIGFAAQAVQAVIPEAVVDIAPAADDDDPILALTTTPLLAAMVNAIKTLNERLTALEAS